MFSSLIRSLNKTNLSLQKRRMKQRTLKSLATEESCWCQMLYCPNLWIYSALLPTQRPREMANPRTLRVICTKEVEISWWVGRWDGVDSRIKFYGTSKSRRVWSLMESLTSISSPSASKFTKPNRSFRKIILLMNRIYISGSDKVFDFKTNTIDQRDKWVKYIRAHYHRSLGSRVKLSTCVKISKFWTVSLPQLSLIPRFLRLAIRNFFPGQTLGIYCYSKATISPHLSRGSSPRASTIMWRCFWSMTTMRLCCLRLPEMWEFLRADGPLFWLKAGTRFIRSNLKLVYIQL